MTATGATRAAYLRRVAWSTLKRGTSVGAEYSLFKEVERERVALEEEDALRAQHEREAEELRREAEKKRPKLTIFDRSHAGPGWIEPRPAQYALNKLNNLEYVELDYFTIKGCREAVADERNLVSNDSLGLAQHGDAIALRPLAAQRPTRRIRKDEDLSWGEMLDAKNMMLCFMEKSGSLAAIPELHPSPLVRLPQVW
ncbi:hypothetical protein EI94DRAFT_1700809 [Lactarius quietus]|nr:hypothetical protein EI94DRAFT_1700809 [Lactarius quietus]